MLAECLLNVVSPGPESKGRWQAPALSSLVSRLAQPPGKPPQPSSPSWHQPPQQADQEVFLDASSDEEDKEAASAGPGPEAGGQELNLSIYSAAAGPFKALLACVGQAPGACYLLCCAAIARNHVHMQRLLVCFAATQNLSLNVPQSLCFCCLLVFVVLQMMSQAFLHQVCCSWCTCCCCTCVQEQVQTGHTYVAWCSAAFRQACTSLQASKLVSTSAILSSDFIALQVSVFGGVLVNLCPLPTLKALFSCSALVSSLLITHRRPTTRQKHQQSVGNLAVATAQQSRLLLQARPLLCPPSNTASGLNATHCTLSSALSSSNSQLAHSRLTERLCNASRCHAYDKLTQYQNMSKKKKRKEYTCWRPFVEKPSTIPACPGNMSNLSSCRQTS